MQKNITLVSSKTPNEFILKIFIGKIPLLMLILFLMALSFYARAEDRGNLTQNQNQMKQFTLPVLQYSTDALAPVISQSTIDYHYGKHLQAYINNLNSLIVGTPFENSDLVSIVKNSEGAIFNNAAQAWNHEFYFNTFSPKAKQAPEGALLKAIEQTWGSFDDFKKEFVANGTAIFGSGWVWLAKTPDGKLVILKEGNAGNPLTKGYTPLLGADVWEHSYYLDYQNRRADHLNALWSITDWKTIESRF